MKREDELILLESTNPDHVYNIAKKILHEPTPPCSDPMTARCNNLELALEALLRIHVDVVR